MRARFNFTFSTTAEGVQRKQRLNLHFLNKLKPSLSRERSFIPFGFMAIECAIRRWPNSF